MAAKKGALSLQTNPKYVVPRSDPLPMFGAVSPPHPVFFCCYDNDPFDLYRSFFLGPSAPAGTAIVYALVARETVILAEYAAGTGNFANVTRKILEKMSQADSKLSYVCDRHIFHIMVYDGLTYICMAEEDFGRFCPPFSLLALFPFPLAHALSVRLGWYLSH
eukprot:3801167-Rhodomonas_salina.2